MNKSPTISNVDSFREVLWDFSFNAFSCQCCFYFLHWSKVSLVLLVNGHKNKKNAKKTLPQYWSYKHILIIVHACRIMGCSANLNIESTNTPMKPAMNLFTGWRTWFIIGSWFTFFEVNGCNNIYWVYNIWINPHPLYVVNIAHSWRTKHTKLTLLVSRIFI